MSIRFQYSLNFPPGSLGCLIVFTQLFPLVSLPFEKLLKQGHLPTYLNLNKY